MFGQAHRRPWRTKKSTSGALSSIRKPSDDTPGATVSIDQLLSAQPGLVPQISGHLTRARIWAATVFVDHFTDLVHVHLMRDQTQDSTLKAKASFERLANAYDVQIQSYHADNGRFAEKRFLDEIRRCNQEISFCAVGAHHQNGIVERKIKDLTLITRTLLLHAKRHWPEMITTMLWPQALKAAETRLNYLTLNAEGRSPISRFALVESQVFIRDFHTWGCPAFVLDGRLQSDPKGVLKWEPRCRVGIYVGHSPVHAGSVALILNPTTGHISPQFHVVFNDTFSTVPHMREETVPPHWAELIWNSAELATDENFDLAQTWFQTVDDPTEAAPLDANIITQDDDEHPPNEGVDEETNTASGNDINEEDPNNPFDSLRAPPHESLQPWTSHGSKGENDNSMPSMVNLEKSGLRRSPCIASMRTALSTLIGGALLFAAFFSSIPTPDGL
ncbi:hypothetical protein ACHAXS_001651, partial [Conticribra weissflogii]